MWLPSMTLIELKVMMMIADARVIDCLRVGFDVIWWPTMNAFLSKFDDVEKIEEDEDKKKEEETDKWPRTPGIVKCNNPLKLNPFGLV